MQSRRPKTQHKAGVVTSCDYTFPLGLGLNATTMTP